jgi:Zn-dependent peptidase ImmA (M78 family)
MSRLPVNANVLEWALADAGVSVDLAAEITGRTPDEVRQWMSPVGVNPHKGDLEKLARRVGRSMQFFFQSRPPAPSANVARFRAAIEGSSRDPAAEIKAIRRATGIQKIVRWANSETNEFPPELPSPIEDPVEYAAILRRVLDWHTGIQTASSSKSAVFKALRARTELRGVSVLYLDAGANNCRGFSLPDTQAPLIALNSQYNLASLKSFTLLHELGHLAHGRAAVCHDPDTSEEQWCDNFAAAFMLPEAHLRAYMQFKQWEDVAPWNAHDRIRLISNRYKMSWQAVAIRLYRLGLTTQSVVDAVMSNSGEQNAGFSADGGRTRPVIRYDEYGSTVVRSVLELREQHLINEFDARKRLNVNGDELSTLKDLALSGHQ